MMSRRAFLLALLAFAGSVGGYLLSRGMLRWPKEWGPKKWAGPL